MCLFSITHNFKLSPVIFKHLSWYDFNLKSSYYPALNLRVKDFNCDSRLLLLHIYLFYCPDFQMSNFRTIIAFFGLQVWNQYITSGRCALWLHDYFSIQFSSGALSSCTSVLSFNLFSASSFHVCQQLNYLFIYLTARHSYFLSI